MLAVAQLKPNGGSLKQSYPQPDYQGRGVYPIRRHAHERERLLIIIYESIVLYESRKGQAQS